MSRKPIAEVLGELTGSETPTPSEAQDAAQVAREKHADASRPRTRLFRGCIEGRDVLVTIHDPEGYGEVAFSDGGRWGVPVELHEEA